MTDPLSSPALWTAAQLAERWQLQTSQVYRLAREGKVPVVKLGRYYRFRLDEIERWEREGGAGTYRPEP